MNINIYPSNHMMCGDVELKPFGHVLAWGETTVSLEPQEYRIAKALFQSRPGIVSLDQLIAAIYPDPDKEPDGGAEKRLIGRLFTLRRKIKEHDYPLIIQTHLKIGYQLQAKNKLIPEEVHQQVNGLIFDSTNRRLCFGPLNRHLDPQLFLISEALYKAYPEASLTSRLISRLYQGVSCTKDPANVLKVKIHGLRRIIKKLEAPVKIVNDWNKGWRLATEDQPAQNSLTCLLPAEAGMRPHMLGQTRVEP